LIAREGGDDRGFARAELSTEGQAEQGAPGNGFALLLQLCGLMLDSWLGPGEEKASSSFRRRLLRC